MQIRQLEERDLDAAGQLYLDAYRADWSLDGAKAYLNKFRAFEPTSCLVAADGEGRIVGALLAYSFTRESGLTLFIQEIFVCPTTRKQGYGRHLISALRDRFATSHQVNVKPLVKADTGVLNFYNSLGFERDQGVLFMDEF